MSLLNFFYILNIWLFAATVSAKRNLVATSLVTCMEDSQVSSNSFDVVFDPDNRALHYSLDMTTEISDYIYANIDVYAYGFKVITKSIDVCSLNWKQFCPVHPGNIQIDSIEYISDEYVKEIPGIAYTVPDIDAYAIINIYNSDDERLACLAVYFSNGKTVTQTGVKWVTAIIAGIGLLVSAALSTFGNSIAASHISANTVSLFLYFQSVVIVCMEHVHKVPPIAAAWCENLAWSMGLIRVQFMQNIFRWYVNNTGGTPALYMTATTMSVLTQRSLEYMRKTSSLFKRAENVLYGNRNTLIFRGIKRVGYSMGIENTSIVCTGFTFFVLCGYFLAGFTMACKYVMELSVRSGWIKDHRFVEFRASWRNILKGALLRYIYIGFAQLTILSLWEFTADDSPAVVLIAVLFLLLVVGIMVWAAIKVSYIARRSIAVYNNPAALLYGDERILQKYGFFYTMFDAKYYWWNIVLLSYVGIKSIFIGLVQASGETEALVIWLLDLAYLVAICYYKPYLDFRTNVLNILICVVTVINSFLFLFFSDLFNQPYTVSAIMGWVFFILNAAFSFILLMMILAYTFIALFSSNPDLRFKPARDDRNSFYRGGFKQNEAIVTTNAAKELMALGDVARDHSENWETEITRTPPENLFVENVFSDPEEVDEKTGYLNNSDFDNSREKLTKRTFSEKILGKFSRRHTHAFDSSQESFEINDMENNRRSMPGPSQNSQIGSSSSANMRGYQMPSPLRNTSGSGEGLMGIRNNRGSFATSDIAESFNPPNNPFDVASDVNSSIASPEVRPTGRQGGTDVVHGAFL